MIHKYWNPVFTTFSAHCWAVHHLMLLVLRGNWCLKVCWLKEPLYCKRFSVFIWQPLASMGSFSSLCVADVYNDYENNLILVSIKLRILEFLILLGGKKIWACQQRGLGVCVLLSKCTWDHQPWLCIHQSVAFSWDHDRVRWNPAVSQVAPLHWVLCCLSAVARKEKKKNNRRQPKGLSSGCVLQGCFPSTCWCSAANKSHCGEGCEIPFYFFFLL